MPESRPRATRAPKQGIDIGKGGLAGGRHRLAVFLGNVFIKHYHNFAPTFFCECSFICLAFLDSTSKAAASLSSCDWSWAGLRLKRITALPCGASGYSTLLTWISR